MLSTSPTPRPTAVTCPACDAPPSVTPTQVAQAILQLRERAGRPPAEQITAVLRVLGLSVVPEPEVPHQRRPVT